MKEAATIIWTAHDGGFQLTVAVHGGSVETFTMDAATFHRQLARAHEAYAEASRSRQCPESHNRRL
jgi:hypothetical protein